MIQTEFYGARSDGMNLYRNYSDIGVMIRKDGTDEIYSEAIDVEGSGYTYSETDIPIEEETEDEQAQKAAAFDYLTGRADESE